MKQLITIMLVMAALKSFSQDWAPFPFGTDMYYFKEGTTFLWSCRQDSTRVLGSSTYYHFNTKAPATKSQDCYDKVMNSAPFNDVDWQPYKMKLTGVGDSLLFYLSDYGTLPAIFKPTASVGTSWVVLNDADNSDMDSIEITCDSIGYGSFLGVSDSLKYFSVHTAEPIEGVQSIDKVTYILSKHYGFVRFLPFHQLIEPTTCEDCFACYDVIGWHSDTSAAGYIGPQWEDWIHLAEGDIIHYKYVYINYTDTSVNFTTHYIQSVEHGPETIVVNVENESGDMFAVTYYKEAIYNALTAPIWSPFYIPTTADYPTLDILIGRADFNETYIDTTTFPGTWRYKQRLYTDALQTGADCSVSYSELYTHEIHWDSYIGATYNSDEGPGFHTFMYVVGYTVSGVTFDGPYALSASEQSEVEPPLVIFPNPAIDEIRFKTIITGTARCEVYDVTGKLSCSTNINTGSLDISDLPAGTYLLKLTSEQGIQTGKFVKL